MKRTRFGRRNGLPREAEEMIWLAAGLADSGSRAEDNYWELRLSVAVDHMLETGNEEGINATLDHLFSANLPAYEALADILEARAESGGASGIGTTAAGIPDNSQATTVLLIAAPVLAWSRFTIPANTLPANALANLRVHLAAHVLADDVNLAIADVLFSPDQLPQGYCETSRFATELGLRALRNQDLPVDPETLPETSRFLSDVRYVLAAVTAKVGAPIFRWQENDGSRELAATQWRLQGGACLAPLLAGCAMELVLPDAFFAASRQADRASRPYSIRASVAFLSSTLETPPNKLRAVVAPFCEREIQEYRISFTASGNSSVIHGVVWPLLGGEEESDIPAQIDTALRECGITEILHLDNRFPIEYCDDCGTPMYPSPEGESVHAELPEDKAEQVPRHLH